MKKKAATRLRNSMKTQYNRMNRCRLQERYTGESGDSSLREEKAEKE
jgi:hypothetical protein